MPARLTHRLPLAVVAVVALGSMSACGGDTEQAADTPASASPSTPTDAASAATLTGDPLEPGAFVDVLDTALEQATTARVEVTTDGSIPVSVTGVVDLAAAPPAADLTLGGAGGSGPTQQVRLVDGVVYSRAGAGDWARTEAFASPLGGMLGQALDRGVVTQVLTAAIDSAADAGTEEVDGESLTRYEALVGTSALADAVEAAREPGQLGSEMGVESLPDAVLLSVLVDGDGLLRQVELDLDATLGTVTATFDDWGDPVDITAPPQGQLSDLPTRRAG